MDRWIADAYLGGDDCTTDLHIASAVGDSPTIAVESAENAARLALENVLELWGDKAKAEEIAR